MTEGERDAFKMEFGRIEALMQLMVEIMIRMPARDSNAAFHAAFKQFEGSIGIEGLGPDLAARAEGIKQTFDYVRSHLVYHGLAKSD